MKHDNYTVYGIHSWTERQFFIGYTSLISISSLIGDTLILIGSLRYKAIKLHEIMVVFIQYLAVADLIFVLFVTLPAAVSLAANGWILGDIYCYINYIASTTTAQAIYLLIGLIALSKFLIVKYPLKAIQVSTKAAHLAGCSVWVYSFIFPIAAMLKSKDGVYFTYQCYSCFYNGEAWTDVGAAVFDIAVGLSVFAVTAVTAVSSVMFLVVARRVPGGLQRQGIRIVLATVAFHVLITTPVVVVFIAYFISNELPTASPTHDSFNLRMMLRWAVFIACLAPVGNFYINCLTLSSFREFLRSRIKKMTALVRRCCAADED